MEAAASSETLGCVHQTTQCHTQEDRKLYYNIVYELFEYVKLNTKGTSRKVE
jgi:hypothetical protein